MRVVLWGVVLGVGAAWGQAPSEGADLDRRVWEDAAHYMKCLDEWGPECTGAAYDERFDFFARWYLLPGYAPLPSVVAPGELSYVHSFPNPCSPVFPHLFDQYGYIGRHRDTSVLGDLRVRLHTPPYPVGEWRPGDPCPDPGDPSRPLLEAGHDEWGEFSTALHRIGLWKIAERLERPLERRLELIKGYSSFWVVRVGGAGHEAPADTVLIDYASPPTTTTRGDEGWKETNPKLMDPDPADEARILDRATELFITHEHADHFSARIVDLFVARLVRDPGKTIVAPAGGVAAHLAKIAYEHVDTAGRGPYRYVIDAWNDPAPNRPQRRKRLPGHRFACGSARIGAPHGRSYSLDMILT